MNNVLIKCDTIRHNFITGKGVHLKMENHFLDVGYIFAPYIPMVVVSEEFQTNQSISSRYTSRTINNRLYQTLSDTLTNDND